MVLDELVGRVRAAQLVDREHEIVLGERGLPSIGHRMFQLFGNAPARLLGLALERLVFHELIGRIGQLRPAAVKLARHSERNDAVVEYGEADAKAIDRRDAHAIAIEQQRRNLIFDVGGSGWFRCEFGADAARYCRGRDLKVGGFSDVEQIDRDDLPMKRLHERSLHRPLSQPANSSFSTNRYPMPITVSICRPACPSFPRRRPTCTSIERVSTQLSNPQTRSRSRSRESTRLRFSTRKRRSSNSRLVSLTTAPDTRTDTASKSMISGPDRYPRWRSVTVCGGLRHTARTRAPSSRRLKGFVT